MDFKWQYDTYHLVPRRIPHTDSTRSGPDLEYMVTILRDFQWPFSEVPSIKDNSD